MSRYDLLIINRSFWPTSPVLGEGLLRLAERLANTKKIAVITQECNNLKHSLNKFKRGAGVKFFTVKSDSNSSQNLILRVLDSFLFMFWVIIYMIRVRPKKIYISTDPPIIVPFVVAIYSKIVNCRYYYHIQDIHPEITNVLFKINSFFFKFLKKLDNFTIQNAYLIITLTEGMKSEIIYRSGVKSKIEIIQNPSASLNESNFLSKKRKKKGFVFTGNLGRLQRIPLLVEAIQHYNEKNGALKFVFAGGGVHSKLLSNMSKVNPLIKYYGIVSPERSFSILAEYEWALLPLEDNVDRYAFPSKASSYSCSGVKILGIFNKNPNILNWLNSYKLGFVVAPVLSELVDIFFQIEKNDKNLDYIDLNRKKLRLSLKMDRFVDNLSNLIFTK